MNVLTFPKLRTITGKMSLLDKFILDEFSPLIGFTNGSEVLHTHGIQWIGDLVACTERELLELSGIGRRKVEKIKAYLEDRGLALDSPNAEWQRRKRNTEASTRLG